MTKTLADRAADWQTEADQHEAAYRAALTPTDQTFRDAQDLVAHALGAARDRGAANIYARAAQTATHTSDAWQPTPEQRLAAIRETVTDRLLQGPDDGWSGSTHNPVARAEFEGAREAARKVLQHLDRLGA